MALLRESQLLQLTGFGLTNVGIQKGLQVVDPVFCEEQSRPDQPQRSQQRDKGTSEAIQAMPAPLNSSSFSSL